MTAAALRVEDLVVTRGRGAARTEILVGVSLTVSGGEILGVSGASGTGKSSLLAVLCGELAPASGQVTLCGPGWSDPPTRARRAHPGSIALVAQDPVSTLDPLWPIGRCVAEPLRAGGMGRAEAARCARDALASVHLGHLDPARRPRRLSVGQAQRVAIARALAAQPVLLLADEPTSVLDVTTAAGIAGLLRSAADAGAAVVVASHDHRLLDALCDRRMAIVQRRLEVAPPSLPAAGGCGEPAADASITRPGPGVPSCPT